MKGVRGVEILLGYCRARRRRTRIPYDDKSVPHSIYFCARREDFLTADDSGNPDSFIIVALLN